MGLLERVVEPNMVVFWVCVGGDSRFTGMRSIDRGKCSVVCCDFFVLEGSFFHVCLRRATGDRDTPLKTTEEEELD